MKSKQFAEKLLLWFDQHGRKDLPWQKNLTPYRVWLSEIMLQQTQVATVIPYFQRFIQHYPTLKKLAAADIDKILADWTGLGYYARARNLHKTAKIIMAQYQGNFPNQLADLQNLPGIGRSTAGAILAIAYNQVAPILDGNVKRVLTRFNGVSGWPGESKVMQQLWQIATEFTPHHRTAAYTQAIMDLGATICLRNKPLCQQCPVSQSCLAYQQNRTAEFPYRNPKLKQAPIRQTCLLILHNKQGEILLLKRPPTGIWGGLWSFPEIATIDYLETWCQQQNIIINSQKKLSPFRHTFTHFHLDIQPISLAVNVEKSWQIMEAEQQMWYKPHQAISLGLAAPIKKLLHSFQNVIV